MLGSDLDALVAQVGPHRVRHLPVTRPLADVVTAVHAGVLVMSAPPVAAADLEAIARIRRRRRALRLVLLTEPGAAALRLRALECGFDEAVPSDLGAMELAGRISLQAERAQAGSAPSLPVADGVELDLLARALRRDGRLVRLRPMEFRLLEELARHPGRPVARTRLLDRVWGRDHMAGSRTVDVHVRWLREKVEREPDRPIHLVTVRGIGYQLEPMAEAVERRPDREHAVNRAVIPCSWPRPILSLPPRGAGGPDRVAGRTTRRMPQMRDRSRRLAAATIMTLVLGAAAAGVAQAQDRS